MHTVTTQLSKYSHCILLRPARARVVLESVVTKKWRFYWLRSNIALQWNTILREKITFSEGEFFYFKGNLKGNYHSRYILNIWDLSPNYRLIRICPRNIHVLNLKILTQIENWIDRIILDIPIHYSHFLFLKNKKNHSFLSCAMTWISFIAYHPSYYNDTCHQL